MEITSCLHKEKIESRGDVEVGECTECHQMLQYGDGKYPTVTKLGRIGDKLVLPNPAFKLLLGPRDKQDLAKAKKATTGTSPGAVPPKPQTKSVALLHQYYEENKEAILHDLDTLGEKAMRTRWDKMSSATFLGLMGRWRPNYPGLPKWVQGKNKRVRKEKRPARSTAVAPSPVVELVLDHPSQRLTITEEDIAQFVDDDFDRFWSLLGQIVRRRSKVITRS